MRIESVAKNNGLATVYATRGEGEKRVRFKVEEYFDRDAMEIKNLCANVTEGIPVSTADMTILSHIMALVVDDYEIRPNKQENMNGDKAQKRPATKKESEEKK